MWKRFVLLSTIMSITFAASNIALPYFLLYLKGSLHSLTAELLPAERVAVEFGVLTSAFMAARVVVAFFSGYVAERIGRKTSIYLGLGLYFLSGLWLIFANSYAEVLIARALQGLASALIWPVAESLLVDLVPEQKTKALMLYVMGFNIGMILGPALGGAMLQASAPLPLDLAVRTPFFLLPLGAAIGFALMLKVPEIVHKTKVKVRELGAKIISALYVFFFNGFVNGFANGIFMSVLVIYVMQYVTSVPASLSALIALSGLLGMALASPLMKRLDQLDFKRKFHVFIGTGVLHKVALALIALTKNYWALLGILTIQNFAMVIVMPLMRSLQSDIIPREVTAKVFGMQQASFNLGMIVGPAVGAVIYKWLEAEGYGGGLTFVIAAIIGLIGVLSFLKINLDELKEAAGLG